MYTRFRQSPSQWSGPRKGDKRMPALSDHRPLGFRGDLSLSPEQVEMMRSLEGHDLWFVEERLIRKGSVAADKVQGAVVEFKRYMALVGLGYRSLGMLSPE